MRSADGRHILMTADAVGGVWTYCLALAAALDPHATRVSLAVLGPSPSAAQREEAAAIPNLTLYEYACRLEWMDEPWQDLDASGRWLLDLESRLLPDLIHLNGYCHAALNWRAPVLVAGHSCIRSWWEAVRGDAAPPRYTRYSEAVARGIAAADLVVAPTAAMLATLDAHYGPLRHARVIRNGRDRTTGPAVKEPMILSAGRLWDEAKNVEALIETAASLSWPVYVAGDRRSPDGDEARLGEAVTHLGSLRGDELARWMARASIFALPARYEPFGLTALEAALGGCALVLGDIRSLREVWGDSAVYVPPDDRAALTSALQGLIGDAPSRTALADRAQERARQMTPARMATDYLRAYADAQRAHRRAVQPA